MHNYIIMNRIDTCIPGLNEIIGGGFPKGDSIILSGPIGSGKTIFSLQYLLKSGENSLYISFEHDINIIKETAKEFGWHTDNNSKFRILKYDPFKLDDILDIIQDNIRDMNAKRVVLDSLSSLSLHIHDESDIRSFLLRMNKILRSTDCTALLIVEVPYGFNNVSEGLERFVSDDALILRRRLVNDEYERLIEIAKMRGGKHSLKLHKYEIDNEGFKIIN